MLNRKQPAANSPYHGDGGRGRDHPDALEDLAARALRTRARLCCFQPCLNLMSLSGHELLGEVLGLVLLFQGSSNVSYKYISRYLIGPTSG